MRRVNLILALTWTMCAALVATIWLYPAIVAAQDVAADPVASNAAQDILLMVVKVVFSILSLLASFLITLAINYFQKKTKIDIPASTEALLTEWADKGIGLAFEKSHQLVKEKGAKLKGPEKMEIALKFVIGMAKEYKLPELGEEKLKDYIEAKLGLKRKDTGVTLEEAEVPNVTETP